MTDMPSWPGYGQTGQPPPGQPPPGQPPPGQPPPGQPPPGQLPPGQPIFFPGGWSSAGMPAPGGVPLRPLAVGDILSGSFTLIRQNPRATLGLTASVATAAVATFTLVAAIAASAGGWVVLFEIPIGITLLGLQLGGLAAAMGRGLLGQRLSISEAVRYSRAGWVMAAIVIVAVIVIALWFVSIALLKGWGIIPALLATAWLGVMMSLTIPVVVLERRGPFAAIGRSWRMIMGSYWRTFGIYLLMYVITAAISFVITFPLGFASGLTGGLGAANRSTAWLAIVIFAIAEIVIASLTATIEAGVIVLVYADMRMRKEGMDLVLRQAAQTYRLTGDEFATSGFASAYTGGAYSGPGAAPPSSGDPAAAYPGWGHPAGAHPGSAYPGSAYPGSAYPGGGYPGGPGGGVPADPPGPDRPA